MITYSESVFVALGNQHATCMYHNVIYDLPVLQYFSTLSHKKHDLKKNGIEGKMCFDFLHNVWNISQSKNSWAGYDTYIYIGLHVKCSLFLSASMKLEFYGQILKNTQLSDVMKMLVVGV
jgi:hypothetical protein